MFEVKSGEPIPVRGGNSGATIKYPLAAMAIGDHFDAPNDMGGCRRQITILSCAKSWAKRNNPTAKFATRTIGDIVRCWRVA